MKKTWLLILVIKIPCSTIVLFDFCGFWGQVKLSFEKNKIK